MKRISRFNKVVIAAALVAVSGGASLGITSFVSANNSNLSAAVAVFESDRQAINGAIAAAGDEVAAITADSTGRMHRGPVSEAMAELFGMTVEELHEEMHSGKSLATIAEEKNVDLSKVTDLVVSEFSAHLDEHVANGVMTREEADEKLATFTENVDEMVTKTRPARGEGKGPRGPKGAMHGEALATLFGMTTNELHEALHSGKSLATIAEEKNVGLSKVTDLLVSELSAHLDEEVASGEITREQADAKLATFTENVDEMVIKTPPVRGEGRIQGHGGPERGHGGHRHGGHRGFSGNESNEEAPTVIEGTGTAFYNA